MRSRQAPMERSRLGGCALWLLLACVTGCVRETSRTVIVVRTTGLGPEVRALEAEVLLAGTPANERYTLAAEEAPFSAQLPSDARGEVMVRLRGLDPLRCVRSSGQGIVQVHGIGRYEVTVPLVPQATPTCATTVELSLTGRRSDLRFLALTVWLDGEVLLGRDLRPAATSPLELSLGARASGQLRIEVAGLGCKGCTLQTGRGELRLERYGRYTLSIPLSEVVPVSCPPAQGRMLEPRQGHGAVLLTEGSNAGSVLFLGGGIPTTALDTIELYDPYSGAGRALGRLLEPRDYQRTVLFPSGPLHGQVMLIGGYVGRFLKSVELYDPQRGTSRSLPPLHDPVNGHTGTLLGDGRVVVIGGHNDAGDRRTVEIFDPVSESWSLADSAPVLVYLHSATLLRDGRILVAGGYVQQTGGLADTAALFDPSAPRGQQWTEVGRLLQPRYHHREAALPDGRALILGGFSPNTNELSASELFDPKLLRFEPAAPMFYRRGSSTVTPLSSGALYLAGGVNWYLTAAYATAELYDPAQARSLPASGLQVKRGAHAATLLPDDGVLLSGGFAERSAGTIQNADDLELTYPLGCTP